MKGHHFLLPVLTLLSGSGTAAVQAEECSDGTSNGSGCSHIEFVGHLTPTELGGPGEVLNDIWGWVDEANGGIEYALIGMQNGTAFVRIHANGDLEYIGRLAVSDGDSSKHKSGPSAHVHKRCHDELCAGEEASAWRDVKVFDHYLYVVSEAEGYGLQVFDLHELSALDGDAPVVFAADDTQPYYGYYDGIGHAHNVFVNEDRARVYVVGHDGNGREGGLHILDISGDPLNPEFIGEADSDGYTHDVQCVVYNGPDSDIAPNSELCFASNEDTLTVWDVTDANAANPQLLARVPYDESGYTHQGWLSEDHRYFFLNDELDEVNSGSRTHLRVFDVTDVNNPVPAAEYLAPTLAIDHNNYVHGRWLYQSNYAAGLRILDVQDPLHPVEAAYFDPQATDIADFYGTWSNFRFPSGLTAFTDIRDGLYVVRPVVSEGGIAPDLALDLSLASSEAEVEESVAGELLLSVDAAVAAEDVLVTLHLPGGGVLAVSDLQAPPGWSCNSDAQDRVQQCRTEALAPDSVASFTFTVSALASGGGEIVAMAYANAADATPDDNLSKWVLDISPKPGTGGGGVAFSWLLPLLVLALARVRRGRRVD